MAVPMSAPQDTWANTLWSRRIHRYPSHPRRYMYLGIVVLIAVVLYYVYWEEGATLPLLLPYYHMSFRYFLLLVVVSNGLGAFAAILGGLADKIGRVNLCLIGTFVIGILQFAAIPNTSSKALFSIEYSIIGIVEGIILVVTPALIRDFSPQVGRATAMGFWTVGPTLGYVVASLVATHTLTHLKPWQDQFVISGAVTLGVFVVAFLGLRELDPALRDQLMVTERERVLVEARAKGVDVEAAIAHPWRTMLKWDLLASSFGISTFLLIFYAAVTIFTLYWVVVFNETTADANGINLWFGIANAITVVVIGFLSDFVRVRKPFMLIGCIGAIVMTYLLLSKTDHPMTGYYTNALIVMVLGIALGTAYPAWMANYTEAVEDKNPALTATGLALWGWVLRIVVAASFLALPYVITTSNPIVDNQKSAVALQAFQAAQPYLPSATVASPPAAPQSVVTGLQQNAGPPGEALAIILTGYAKTHNLFGSLAAVPDALKAQVNGLLTFNPLASQIKAGKQVTPSEIATVRVNSPQLAALLEIEGTIVKAQKAAPAEWKRWWWVCIGGQVVFLVIIFFMRGTWSPAVARREAEEREHMVDVELAKLHLEEPHGVLAGP
ncbi:MAG TPA: MFS transporter [Acidimicrobiales bacterium]|nr:MFS transporter [Acidimicrobiales bacterium]